MPPLVLVWCQFARVARESFIYAANGRMINMPMISDMCCVVASVFDSKFRHITTSFRYVYYHHLSPPSPLEKHSSGLFWVGLSYEDMPLE
jgi:hypothetical protein